LQLVQLDLKVGRGGGQQINVAPGSCNLEWLSLFASGLDVDHLAWLNAEGGAVNQLAIDENVTVHNHLAGLRCGSRETGAQYQCVKSHLEELDQVLTGEALGLAGFFEDATKLRLTDSILCTKTLLFTKTHGVVAISLALGTPVLTRSVGTLLKILGRLGR
jgi:hypothetical protein